MHGPSAGHQKDMLHTAICDNAKNVIGKLHCYSGSIGSNTECSPTLKHSMLQRLLMISHLVAVLFLGIYVGSHIWIRIGYGLREWSRHCSGARWIAVAPFEKH